MFCQEEFHLRSGGLWLVGSGRGTRGLRCRYRRLCSLLIKEVVTCWHLILKLVKNQQLNLQFLPLAIV